MSGSAETERERICREAVVAYLERLGLAVVCGPKRLDDPPDYDLSVSGEAFALEASTLEDDEPGVDLKPVTRERRFEELCARLEHETRAEGSLRHGYEVAYPLRPFKRPARTEEAIFEGARRAIREDAGVERPERFRTLWSPYEELENPHPALRGGFATQGVELFCMPGQPAAVRPRAKPRARSGDGDDLARGEIIPRIEEIAERKGEGLKGEARPKILALANEHLFTGSSNYAQLFAKEGNPHGFAEIFIVGREAVPLLGRFKPAG